MRATALHAGSGALIQVLMLINMCKPQGSNTRVNFRVTHAKLLCQRH